jgi:rubrerythrin
MGMNPFDQKAPAVGETLVDLKQLATKPYNKNTVNPYTRLRAIMMNGTEYEAVWNSHQFARHCGDNDLRRDLSLIRRVEQQQQKRIAALKPANESILETTIGYEQLAVDLTATIAAREKDRYVKAALDFALLEDFDHLYRYADLLEGERGIKAEKLVGKYTEIMPGRPTIAEHRHPFDDVRRHIVNKKSQPLTKLHIGIITAAEQQTMNYYMNLGAFYDSEQGRKLYTEIGMIEEQHVTHYESLKDTNATWLECLLMHEYAECYLYYSCYMTETDERIKTLWEEFFEQEVAHLHLAAKLLKKYERKSWQQVIPEGKFPAVLKLGPMKEYIRKVMSNVSLTSDKEDYVDIDRVPDNAHFFEYQQNVISHINNVPTHKVIDSYIGKNGKDYRYQIAAHPVPELRDRKNDNTNIARTRA